MKLIIGGPTRDLVPAAFVVSAAELYAFTRERGPWSDVQIGWLASTYIHVGRELFLEAAIKRGATHVFWLDTDMDLPRETIVLLAAAELPVLALNYRVRQPSGLFTAHRDGQRLATTETSHGVEPVDYCGLGAMLMRTDVVADLPRPWFRHGLNPEGGDVGEDVQFCRRLNAAGHQVYIDHDLSKPVEHLGQTSYRTIPEAVAV